jgi:hypothetical protein
MTFRSSSPLTPPPEPPLEAHKMDISCLNHAKFQEILLRAEPLVVNNVHHIMQGEWTPEYFVQRFGSQEVMITDCETNYDYSSTVSQFFRGFGTQQPRIRTDLYDQVLKLKVMPPLCAFPRLTRSLRRTGPRRTTSRMCFLNCMRRF